MLEYAGLIFLPPPWYGGMAPPVVGVGVNWVGALDWLGYWFWLGLLLRLLRLARPLGGWYGSIAVGGGGCICVLKATAGGGGADWAGTKVWSWGHVVGWTGVACARAIMASCCCVSMRAWRRALVSAVMWLMLSFMAWLLALLAIWMEFTDWMMEEMLSCLSSQI